MVNFFDDFSGAVHRKRLSKIPVTVQRQVRECRRCRKNKKEHPDTLCISTDPVHIEKTHDEQSRPAPEETVPEERDSMTSPPYMQTDRSFRPCLSRVVPPATRHEARSMSMRRATLPERRRSEEASQDVYADFKSVGRPRAVQERSVRIRRDRS